MSKFPNLKNGDFNVDEKTGIITIGILSGGMTQKYQYGAAVDFKAFYKELHDTLVNNKKVRFLDMLGTSSDQKIGKFIDYQRSLAELEDAKEHENRTGDMFEKKFVWADLGGGAVEMEMEWQAKANSKHSGYGWYELKIDLVCRRMVEKEFLVGDKKIKLQEGSWEFRNKLVYKNKIVLEYFPKVPFVKDNLKLQQLYLDHIYYKPIVADYKDGETKILPIVTNLIEKYFRSS